MKVIKLANPINYNNYNNYNNNNNNNNNNEFKILYTSFLVKKYILYESLTLYLINFTYIIIFKLSDLIHFVIVFKYFVLRLHEYI